MATPSTQPKTVLVTGATTGIGLATAAALADQGWRVLMHGRSAARCQAAMAHILQKSPQANLDFATADFASLQSVRQFASQVKSMCSRLDVLVNNAGVMNFSRQTSQDGIEMTVAVNHLAPFLLTQELLDLLKASPPARVVNVSSEAHASGSLNFNDLQMEKRYMGFKAYSDSKLMNVYFTYELARRLQGTGVTVNALHPGFVASDFAKNNGPLARLGMAVISKLHIGSPKTTRQGAETSVFLASSPSVEGVSGKYFDNCQAIQSSPASYDQTAAARLWEWSEKAIQ